MRTNILFTIKGDISWKCGKIEYDGLVVNSQLFTILRAQYMIYLFIFVFEIKRTILYVYKCE